MAHFQTKYGIGDTLYAPRCYMRGTQETVVVDGKEYSRKTSVYEAVVRKRVVTAIVARIDLAGEVTANYYLDETPYPMVESYLDRMHPRLDCARLIAEEHEKNKTVFYG